MFRHRQRRWRVRWGLSTWRSQVRGTRARITSRWLVCLIWHTKSNGRAADSRRLLCSLLTNRRESISKFQPVLYSVYCLLDSADRTNERERKERWVYMSMVLPKSGRAERERNSALAYAQESQVTSVNYSSFLWTTTPRLINRQCPSTTHFNVLCLPYKLDINL